MLPMSARRAWSTSTLRVCVAALALLWGGVRTTRAGDISPQHAEFFEAKIRPVLAAHCFPCHSAQAEKLKAGLRLDSLEGLLKGGESGSAIVPGDPGKSLLNKAVGYGNPDSAMPPKAKLDDRIISDLETWVKMGAPWPDQKAVVQTVKAAWNWAELRRKHWAFQPIKRHAPPALKTSIASPHPIDCFIRSKLEVSGLRPAVGADRRTLLRRVSLDLIGLPPTWEEIVAFEQDRKPEAFARVVDRLLASPHYGERWARHWLDLARYSDGMGNFLDGAEKRAEAWRYRDWVVKALNRDMPFDRFVKSQIAGDLMDEESLVGVGFLALGPNYQSDGGTEEGKAVALAETLDDRVDTVTRGLLGLTVMCARCHDHKFDPIPIEDYYSLAGVFQNTRNEEQMEPGTPKAVVEAYDAGQKAIQDSGKRIAAMKDAAAKEKRDLTQDEKSKLAEEEKSLEVFKKSAPAKYAMVHVVADSGSVNMRVALRGNLLKPGEVAPRRFLRILGGDTGRLFTRGSGRLDLAEAIADPENPLTARVMVNRVWMHHFGRALVRTPDNFGTAGEKPTHPELLDWLASRFIDSGWSLKALHRTILLSESYQMSSQMNSRSFEKDGDNRLIWRMEPRRLDVEAWRDSLLATTDGLDLTLGGPSTDALLKSSRRTLYTLISRNGDRLESDDFLRLFDLPSARATSPGRDTSIVPQQFLFMMNNTFMNERAKALVARLKTTRDDTRILEAYRLVHGRRPTGQERKAGLAFLRGAGVKADESSASAWKQYAQVLLSCNELLFVR